MQNVVGGNCPYDVLRKSRIKLSKFDNQEQSNCVNQLAVLRRIYAKFTHDTQDLRNINIYATFTHHTQHLRTGIEQGFWNLTVVLITHDTQDLRMISFIYA
jgi:hypothetical protein